MCRNDFGDRRASSARSVDAGAVLDPQHDQGVMTFVDLVADSVGATARRMKAGEFTLQAHTDSMRIPDECREHELHDHGGSALGQPVEVALGRARSAQFVRTI
jgi:hypothetical protein